MDNVVVTGITGPVSGDEENVQPITDSMGPTPPKPILGKFKSAEDLAKAYTELEKKLGKGVQTEEEPTEDEDEDSGEEDGDSSGDEAVDEVLEVAGLKLSELTAEWEAEGTLSDESYEALEEAGIPRALVDAYIQGQEALLKQGQEMADSVVSELMEVAGGPDEYASMIAWAGNNLSEEEIEAYNMAIRTGNKHLASMAVKGLAESYHREYGSDPDLLGGEGGYLESSDKFNSVDEMTRAMSDPRYMTDAHFRKQVEAKVIRSKLMRRSR
jgi:hypothetical protein